MCEIFVIQVSFRSSERLEIDSRVYVIKILFNLNSQENKKFELFSQGTNNLQSFEHVTLLIADYENEKKSENDWLAAKLRLKERTILSNVCTFESMNLD